MAFRQNKQVKSEKSAVDVERFQPLNGSIQSLGESVSYQRWRQLAVASAAASAACHLAAAAAAPDLAEQDAVSVIMQSVVGYTDTGIRPTCTRPTPHWVRNDI